jgi:hypothetical protein
VRYTQWYTCPLKKCFCAARRTPIYRMDRTSITLGSDTRNALREYKRERDLPNYDAALEQLLSGRGERSHS